MAGRKSAMTEPVRAKILDAVRAGNYREVAAPHAGVSAKTLRAYCAKKRDPVARAFRAALLEAEAAVEIELVGAIKKMATGDLKAATWYLSRKFPQRWAEKADEVKKALKLLQQLAGAKPSPSD